MKWTVLLMCCLCYSLTCISQQQLLKAGDKFDTTGKACIKTLLLPSPGQMKEGYACKIDHIDYNILLDQDGKITLLTTSDMAVVVKKVIKVGMTYKDTKQYEANKQYIRGWGYVVDVGADWKCVFWDKAIRQTGQLADSSRIAFFVQ